MLLKSLIDAFLLFFLISALSQFLFIDISGAKLMNKNCDFAESNSRIVVWNSQTNNNIIIL